MTMRVWDRNGVGGRETRKGSRGEEDDREG